MNFCAICIRKLCIVDVQQWHFTYCDEVTMALMLYMKPVHGLPDPCRSLSNSIPPAQVNSEVQKTKTSGKWFLHKMHSSCWDWNSTLASTVLLQQHGIFPGSSSNHLATHCRHDNTWLFLKAVHTCQTVYEFVLLTDPHPLATSRSKLCDWHELIYNAFNFRWCALATKIKFNRRKFPVLQ